MLISFSVENWMSFKERATFSMTAGRERQHKDRLPEIKDYGFRLLPIAAIYGGNASGKSNLCKALIFARNLVTESFKSKEIIPVKPFVLDESCSNIPTTFIFEILVNSKCYEFGFKLTRKCVEKEWLIEIPKSKDAKEKELYCRENNQIKLADKLEEKPERLIFAFDGTHDNQLFLSNSVSQKIDTFKPIYEWFEKNLVIITPTGRLVEMENEAYFKEDTPLRKFMDTSLSHLDTGISHLGSDEIPFDTLPIRQEILQDMKKDMDENLNEGESARLCPARILVTRKKGELCAFKLISFHRNIKGEAVKFDLKDESDGTKRVIDLLPAFHDVSQTQKSKIYVIDEVDRSLHILLIQQLIKNYLACCNADTRSQIIFTTHNVLLMDQNLLRRDELWVTERDSGGGSELISFGEYKDVRGDKDIRKSYLQGRLGGIPQILPFSTCPSSVDDKENEHLKHEK